MGEKSDQSNSDSEKPPLLGSAEAESVVSWRLADGSIVSTGPLPRDRAERLAAAYRSLSPDQQYWVGPLPPELQSAREGRVRRRRLSRNRGSSADH